MRKKKLISSINFRIGSFGNLNSDKYFYVIRRNHGAGFFSNLLFVLNHLLIAEKHNLIPIIDMENFPTWYNEKDEIIGTKNAWEYYFKPLNEYSLEEIYQSKNVILTSKVYPKDFIKFVHKNDEIVKVFNKYIKIKKYILDEVENYFEKKLTIKNKVLGVHLRGGEVKTAPGHTYPPSNRQIIYNLNKVIEKDKYQAIFLSTKEFEYINLIKYHFPSLKIYLSNTYRNKKDTFDVYPRLNHRYLLGKEILIETLTLSKLNYFFFNLSNVSLAAMLFSNNKMDKKYYIKNDLNSSNRTIARFSWKIKNFLPHNIGGFKLDTLKEIT